MAVQMINLLYTVISLLTASTSVVALSDKEGKPTFAFSWLDDNNTFEAGGIGIIKIKLFGNLDKNSLKPVITVNEKVGNSCYISGVSFDFEGDPSRWTISFTAILVGIFNVLITEDNFKILDSSLHFQVVPGPVYPCVCVASWLGFVNEFIAGTRATVFILLKDAFGNNISPTGDGANSYNFSLSASNENGSRASLLNVTYMGWNALGYVSLEFVPITAGSLLLHIEGDNQTLNGSPLPFKVKPGPLDVSNCEAEWNFGTNVLQIFSKMEIFIHQKDQYGNLVPGLYAFDAQVVEKETNLSVPEADMLFEEIVPGIQLLSTSVFESGNFTLTIFDMNQNKRISKMPYDFTVFVGYCDGVKSIVNGSGLESSVAGEVAKFSVYLKDVYEYPSPVEVERLRVQIVREADSYHVWPSIYPIQPVNGSGSTDKLSYGSISAEIATAPSLGPNNNSSGKLKVQSSAFEVIYKSEKGGIYEITVFCGNIQLHGGHSFRKEVKAGEIDISLSGVVKFSPKVPKLTKSEIVVQLMDSFHNPVPLQQSKLQLEIGSVNHSGFRTLMFADNENGLYVGYYLVKDAGTYELCASFDHKHFSPCPFGVNVYDSEYFSKAYDDSVSVWEDESIAFDALANDYFAGGNASITDFTKPGRGSLLQHGQLFRYTPYKGFSGNDSFLYTISDVNGNLATGAVHISVLTTPPQFVSFPSLLKATEDTLSPRFGGFPGFTLSYSDLKENLSVTVSAKSGTIFLSPMLMQFWQPMWSGLSVNQGDKGSNDLILRGSVELINFALQSIQYLGNENFCGDDTIQVSAMNKYGKNDLEVPVFVEPINDPPFIHVPEFIILKKSDGDGSLIFDRERDEFEFSIGDPDLVNFPGGEYRFLVTFSIEVNSGILITSLPAELVDATELKLKNSYQWHPLQTFVTISKHFMVKAKGVRIRGTINDCNSIMQQLLYHGGEHGAVLTVMVNDLGNYGCHMDCAENISVPLFVEATVNLISRRPISSLEAHSLGSAVVIEFIMVFSLGLLLLFFTCKCAIVLVHERRSQDTSSDVKLIKPQSVHNQTSGRNLSEKVTYFTGRSSPLLPSGQPSNFRQRSRSRRHYGSGESSKDASQSFSDHCQQITEPNFMPLSMGKGKGETV